MLAKSWALLSDFFHNSDLYNEQQGDKTARPAGRQLNAFHHYVGIILFHHNLQNLT